MFKWVIDNWQTVSLGIIAVASIIVKFTKNDNDNKALEKILNILEKISIFNTDKQRKILESSKEIVKVDKDEAK